MEQTDLFGNPLSQPTDNNVKTGLNIIDGGEFIYYPDYFSKADSDRYLNILVNSIEWRQDKMNMYGKEINFPRLTAWYGNGDKPYTFSGTTLPAKVWTPELLEIKAKIDALGKVDFNSVLLNRYRSAASAAAHQSPASSSGRSGTIAAEIPADARS